MQAQNPSEISFKTTNRTRRSLVGLRLPELGTLISASGA